ncbi:histidinol-phosphate transaminase [Lentilactobacillus curieae]|uniref:Histidinol-phosphate aminotransferase n=1 Tax=Lentilactobacillus curieae TaxID=1138822 RepID=A0A1S6QG18_9LACO|nr:histidinol-phosphate transaminase [Lentilactobacillus curieae]AQW20556.1 histidinol-phosphate transaminase [Lentilactobacillus curieae]
MKKVLQSLRPYTPEKPLSELKSELGVSSLVRLSANENVYGTSPKVSEALLNWAAAGASQYPDSNASKLRAAVAKQFNLNQSSLVFGNGLDEIIQLICRVILEPDDEVLIPTPTFSEYQLHSSIEGAQIVPVELTADLDISLEKLKAAVTEKTKLIWLCNPNNPTGSVLSRQQILKFASGLPTTTLLVVDEAYIDFTDTNETLINDVEENENLIVLRTLSKAYGLANFRVGFAVCPNSLVSVFQTVRLPYNLSTAAEVAAVAALADQSFLSAGVQKIKESRQQLMKFFTGLKIQFVPSQTNFIFLKVEDENGLADELAKSGYLVRTGLLPGWLRITIGKPDDNLAIEKIVQTFISGK